MGNEVYIASDDNQINLVNTDRQIVITQPNCNTSINVNQPVTSVVEILTGPPGPAGIDGRNAFPFTGSAIISGSLIVTGSTFTSLTASAGLFSGSGAELFNIPASAVVGLALNQITTGSVSASVNLGTNAFTVKSGSITFLNISNQGVTTITGSLTVSGSSTFTNIGPAVFSGSVNITGSGVLNGANILTDAITGSLVFTSSFNAFTASYKQDSASFDTRILSNSSSIALLSGSYLASSASFATRILNNSSSIASLSSSYLASSASFDNRINIISSSYATTGSNTFVGNQIIQGNITVRGTASVDVLITNYESSSIIYASGSTKFGDTLDDTHEFTGSLFVTGSTVSLQGGSFSGSGANLFNIPASGITGLNLSQIATGSISASVSLGTGSFTITSGSSNFLFVSSSGNVGIGTTATTAKLTVNGSIAFSSYNNIIGNNTYPANAVYSAALIGTTTIADGGGAGIKFTDSGGSAYVKMGFGNLNTTIGQSSFGVVPDLGARLGVRGAGTTSSTTAFLVQNSNASSSLAVLDNGRVGIGTTTPAYQLSVVAPNAGDGIAAYVGSSGMIMTGNAGFGNPGIASTNGYIHVNATLNGTGGNEVLNVNKSTNGAYIQAWRSQASSILTLVAGDGSIGIKTSTPSASLHVVGNTILSGSAGTGSALLVYKSGSTVVDIQGSQGQLFSVVDALSGSLMSVNDVSGLPILEVFSDDRVVMGTYGAPGLTVTGSVTIASGSFSGSFFGNGSGLTNISASAIVGLNLSQIATGSISASVSTGTGSFTVSSGSTSLLYVSNSGSIGISTSTPFSDIPTVGSGSIDVSNARSNITVGGFAVLGKTSQSGYGAVGSNYYLDNANALRRRNNDWVSAITFNVGGFDFQSATTGAVGSAISLSTLAYLNNSGNFTIGNGTTTLGARIGIKGSGATSSTTSFLVQNANATTSLSVLDDGDVGIGTATPISSLDIRGTQSATGSIARTMLISSSLSASANNDVLVGLDIAPTFANSAFTGVTNYAIRTIGDVRFQLAGYPLYGLNITNALTGETYISKTGASNLIIEGARGVNISPTNNVGVGILGSSLAQTKLSVFTSVGTSPPSLGSWGGTFSVVVGGDNGQFGLLTGVVNNTGNAWFQAQRVDANATAYNILLQPTGGNVLIGTSTNAGYRLNVSGSGNFTSNLTVSGSATNSLLVRGSGTTVSTTSLLVQNSAGTSLLSVRDDNVVNVGTLIPDQILFNGGTQKISVNGTGNATSFYSSGVIGQKITSQTGANLLLTPGTLPGNTVVIESTGGTSPNINNSAILQANSTTQGFLPPRTDLLSNISAPAQGLQAYVTASATEGLYLYNSGSTPGWQKVITDAVTGSMTVVSASYALTASYVNPLNQNVLVTGSLLISRSSAGDVINITPNASDNAIVINNSGFIKFASGIDSFIRGSSTVFSILDAGYVSKVQFHWGGSTSFINTGGDFIVGATSGLSAKLGVKGSGTTSSTTALLVQDSNGTGSLVVRDDGQIQVRSTTTGNPGYSFIDNTNTGLYMFGGTMGTVVNGQYSILYNTEGPSFYSNTTNSLTAPNLLLAKIGSAHRMSVWMNGSNNFQFQAWQSGVGYGNSIILQELGGNVGIGTATPAYKLDVSGSGNFSNSLTVTGSLIVSGSSTFTNIGPAIFSGSITQTASTASFGGVVGIGTTTPAYKLDVNGSARATSLVVTNLLTINNSSQGSNTTFNFNGTSPFFYADTYAINIGATTTTDYLGGVIQIFNKPNLNNLLVISDGDPATGATERLRVTKGGSVLIGTSTGTGRLSIKGAGATSSTTALLVQNSNLSSSLSVLDDGTATIASTLTIGSTGNAGTINLARSSNGGITGAIVQTNDITQFYNYQGAGIDFYVAAATTVQRAFIRGTGLGVSGTTGGVFTLNASAALQINATTQGFLQPRMTTTQKNAISASATGLQVYDSTINKNSLYNGTNWTNLLVDTGSQSISGSLELTSALTASNAVISGNVTVLGTASINTLIVNQTQLSTGSNQLGDAADDFQTLYGTVRIPTGSLTVSGSATISSTNGVGGVIISHNNSDTYFTATGTNNSYRFDKGIVPNGTVNLGAYDTRWNGIYSSLFLPQYGSAAVPVYAFDDGIGNVVRTGIFGGTNFLGLSVSASQQIGIGVGTTSITGSAIIKGSGATSSTTALLVQNSGATASLAVLDNGNVGIGTTSPGVKFQVGDSSAVQFQVASSGASIYVGPPVGNYNMNITANTIQSSNSGNTNTPLYLQPAGTGNIIIGSGGSNKVLIGTSGDAGFKLDVNGTGRFSSNLTVTGSVIIDGGLFDTTSTGSLATGSTLIYSVDTGSYTAGFFDYHAVSGSNGRAGTIMSFWLGGQVQYTDNSTPDVGNTSNIAFSMSLAGSSAQLFASASSAGWNVKTSFRTI